MVNIADHHLVSEAYGSHFESTLSRWNEEEVRMNPLDWEDYLKQGISDLETHEKFGTLRKIKGEMISEWIENQLRGNEIIARDYRTGQTITIGEYDP